MSDTTPQDESPIPKAVTRDTDSEVFEYQPDRWTSVPHERRHDLALEQVQPNHIKVRVTLYLDSDIVQFFKEKAKSPDAAKYQTQINRTLRSYIEREREEQTRSGRADGTGDYLNHNDLIEDENFIAAVAERVRELEKTVTP
jgi:uncharacterized protein (DUF4415 family)